MSSNRKKDFILNLNVFRNTHFRKLNAAKIRYKALMQAKIEALPKLDQVMLVYTLYPESRRLCDVGNVCSIHEKFFCDALVELGRLPDDDYRYLPDVVYRFGGIDKVNPRVEIEITSIDRQVDIWKFCKSTWSMVKASIPSKKQSST